MSLQQIKWSDIAVNGKSTGKYICSQSLDALLRDGDKEEALARKFIVRKCTKEYAKHYDNCSTWLDMTLEDVFIENATPELENVFSEHDCFVIEGYDAHSNHDGEDPPSIVINENTKVYPVDFVDC